MSHNVTVPVRGTFKFEINQRAFESGVEIRDKYSATHETLLC